MLNARKPKLHFAGHVTTCSMCKARRDERVDKLDTAKMFKGLLTSLTCRARRVEPCCSTSSTQLKCMDSTCSTCRARRDERVEPCCSTSSTQPKCMGLTRRTCRVEMWRAKWNLSYIIYINKIFVVIYVSYIHARHSATQVHFRPNIGQRPYQNHRTTTISEPSPNVVEFTASDLRKWYRWIESFSVLCLIKFQRPVSRRLWCWSPISKKRSFQVQLKTWT